MTEHIALKTEHIRPESEHIAQKLNTSPQPAEHIAPTGFPSSRRLQPGPSHGQSQRNLPPRPRTHPERTFRLRSLLTSLHSRLFPCHLSPENVHYLSRPPMTRRQMPAVIPLPAHLSHLLALLPLRSVPVPFRSHVSALFPLPFPLTRLRPTPSPRPPTRRPWGRPAVRSQPQPSSPTRQKIRSNCLSPARPPLGGGLARDSSPLHPPPISTPGHPPCLVLA